MGNWVEVHYAGTLPAADCPGISYQLYVRHRDTVETDNSICNSLTWKPMAAKMRFIPVWTGDTLSAVCLPITTLRCGGSYLTTERMPSTFCAVRMVRR